MAQNNEAEKVIDQSSGVKQEFVDMQADNAPDRNALKVIHDLLRAEKSSLINMKESIENSPFVIQEQIENFKNKQDYFNEKSQKYNQIYKAFSENSANLTELYNTYKDVYINSNIILPESTIPESPIKDVEILAVNANSQSPSSPEITWNEGALSPNGEEQQSPKLESNSKNEYPEVIAASTSPQFPKKFANAAQPKSPIVQNISHFGAVQLSSVSIVR
jgi:hypothetical protein